MRESRQLERSRRLAILASGVLLAAAIGCGDRGPETPAASAGRGILVITIDGLRADRLSSYGGALSLPVLESIASEATRFEDLATPVPLARPAVVSMWTGSGPDLHGVRNNTTDRLSGNLDSTVRVLSGAGWETAAFVSTPLVSYASGLDRHFDLFDGPEDIAVGPERYVPANRPASEVVDHAILWMRARPAGSRWVSWVHLGHAGGVESDSQPGEAVGVWADAIGALDAPIARLRAAAVEASAGSPIDLILVGTHGVLLDEDQGACGSAYWLEDRTLRVAAMWGSYEASAPVREPTVDRRPRSLTDVGATVLAIAGLEGGGGADGVSLAVEDPGSVRDVRRAWTWATEDELAWSPLTAVDLGDGWRSFATRDLDGEGADRAAARERPARPAARTLPGEVRARLEALGFDLGPDGAEVATIRDPEERNRLLRELSRLRHLFRDGKERPVARTTKRLLDEYPDNLGVIAARTWLALMAQAPTQSEELQVRLLERYPSNSTALHLAAHAEMLAGRDDRALPLLDAARAVGAVEPELLYDAACVHARLGDIAKSLVELRAAVDAGYRDWRWMELDPDLATVRSDPDYGRILAEHGR